MSLDIELWGPGDIVPCTCCDCGHMHSRVKRECLYSANLTHNLNRMADAAGVYRALWRPGEHGLTKARQLIEPLRIGIEALRRDPDKFRALNPANGWGTYDGLLEVAIDYLAACEANPDADVEVSR